MKNFLDLFSGIGGFALGAQWADMKFDKHYYCCEKPKEWAVYKSITARDYNLEYPQGYENYLTRSDDGLPTRVDRDRVKCLGNAVVPQIAAMLWDKIKEAEG